MSDTWLFEEDRIVPDQVPWRESLFSIANGHLGTRGSFEEGFAGSIPATFMHGLFVNPKSGLPYLFPLPDWTAWSITLDGVRFRLDQHPALGYERSLDMRTGVLTRKVLWRGPGTGVVRVEFRRLLSLAKPELASAELTITSLTGDVEVTVATGLDATVTSPSGDRWDDVSWERTAKDHLVARVSTSGGQAEVTAATRVSGMRSPELINDTRHPRLTTTFGLGRDERVTIAKHTTYRRGIEQAVPHIPSSDFNSIAAESAAEWARRWATSHLEIGGDPYSERVLRFAAFHVIGAAPRSTTGAGIGARLLSGYGYLHHVFWDTDVFVIPYLNMTQPDLAGAHIGYRYGGLGGARRKATRYGRSGAFYAWESAGTGDECTPEWGDTPDGERVRILTGEIEEHIVADVAYALDHYLSWTGDTETLRSQGAEIVLDGARYWQGRIEIDSDERGHIRNVIGPNEYHVGVDDNFFTNAMAAWHLRAAVRIGAELRNLDHNRYDELLTELGLQSGWDADFERLANAVTPSRKAGEVFEEHHGYFALDDVDLSRFRPRHSSMQHVLGEKRIAQSQITKQADVIMGTALLRDYQEAAGIASQLDYYGPRTDHGSSLSLAVHALAASMAGQPGVAYDHFRAAAAIDHEDSMGNGHHGIHAATQGGLLQAAMVGFAGLHLTVDGPEISPRLPEPWESLGLTFVYRGTRYEREAHAGRPTRGARAPRADNK